MANKRIDTMQIKQVLQLHLDGFSNRRIAKTLSLSRNTVNGYIKLFKASDQEMEQLNLLPMEALHALIPSPLDSANIRFRVLREYFPQVKLASKQTGFTLQQMWREYRVDHLNGYGYSQFVYHYRAWDAKHDVTLSLQHKAGESVMVDYAGKRLNWVNPQTAEVIDVEIFVACMPCSGYTFVYACSTQGKEDFIRCMIECFNFFGGAPKVVICDNLKSAVTKASKYEAVINRSFRDMALYYNCTINPTRTYHPKDKAMVERMVRLVYERIYFKMRNETHFSLHQLNERIRDLLLGFNDAQLSQVKKSRTELFISLDQPLLKPLPGTPYQIKHFQRAKVQKNTHVFMSTDKHYYSVPYRYIGKYIQIQYNDRIVEIYFNHERIATHHREKVASGYTTKEDHLPSAHQMYRQWSPKYFIDKAEQIGPCTVQYLQRLFEQNGVPEAKYKTAMGIIHLKRQYSSQALDSACAFGMIYPHSSYLKIRSILEKGLDQYRDLLSSIEEDSTSHIQAHSNIRGKNYYQS